MNYKQLAPGDDKTQYHFMVRTDRDTDNIFLAVKTEKEVRMYLTSSKLDFRGAGIAIGNERMNAVSSGDPKAEAEFVELLRVCVPRSPNRFDSANIKQEFRRSGGPYRPQRISDRAPYGRGIDAQPAEPTVAER